MFYVKINKKNEKKYAMLICDLGYTTKVLTFNQQDIAEILGVSVRELMDYDAGDIIKL